MPSFNAVPINEAQPQPATSVRALLLKEYESFIGQLGPRQAGRLTPEAGETVRAVRVRLGAAARLAGVQLVIRRTPEAVYFWKAATRGRPRRPTIA